MQDRSYLMSSHPINSHCRYLSLVQSIMVGHRCHKCLFTRKVNRFMRKVNRFTRKTICFTRKPEILLYFNVLFYA